MFGIELFINPFETFLCQWHKPKSTPIKSDGMLRLVRRHGIWNEKSYKLNEKQGISNEK